MVLSDQPGFIETASSTALRQLENHRGDASPDDGLHPLSPMSPLPSPSAPPKVPSLALSATHHSNSQEGGGQVADLVKAQYREAVFRLRDKIASLRQRALFGRLGARRRRRELRRHRATAKEVDAQLIKALSEDHARGLFEASESIVELLERSRAARDILGFLEDSYDEMEDEVNMLEDQLETAESRLYEHYRALESHPGFEELEHFLSAESSLYAPSSVSEGRRLSGTEVEKYKEKSREADVLQHRIWGQLMETARRLEEDESSDTWAIDKEPFSEHLLKEFNQIHDTGLDELDRVDAQALELRNNCVEKGLLLSEDLPYEAKGPAMLVAPFLDSNQEHLPRLFSQAATRSDYFEYLLSGFENTRDRINRWLLHMLRTSPLEVDRHKAELDGQLADEADWSGLVMQTWPQDEFARAGSLSAVQSDNRAATAPVTTLQSTTIDSASHSPIQSGQGQTRVRDDPLVPAAEELSLACSLEHAIHQADVLGSNQVEPTRSSAEASPLSVSSPHSPSSPRQGLDLIAKTIDLPNFAGLATLTANHSLSRSHQP